MLTFIYYPYELRQGNSEFFEYYIKICQIDYMLKMYLIFEVLRLIGAVFGTASVVKTIDKFSLFGHLLPIKEKHLMESFSSDWPITARAFYNSYVLCIYQAVSEHISDHMVICE